MHDISHYWCNFIVCTQIYFELIWTRVQHALYLFWSITLDWSNRRLFIYPISRHTQDPFDFLAKSVFYTCLQTTAQIAQEKSNVWLLQKWEVFHDASHGRNQAFVFHEAHEYLDCLKTCQETVDAKKIVYFSQDRGRKALAVFKWQHSRAFSNASLIPTYVCLHT